MIITDVVERTSESELCASFRAYTTRIRDLGANLGIKIVPFRDRSLPFFSRQPLVRQQSIIKQLQTYWSICEATMASGGTMVDPVTSTWNAIKHMHLRPCSDLFSHISDHNVIEIHDAYGIQIFRNLNFYTYCSYSLEELFVFPWSRLYSRDEETIADLWKVVERIYKGEVRNTIQTGLQPHIIEEVYSPFKFRIQADVEFISPLFDEINRPVATVVIERGQLAGRPLTPREEERLLAEYVLPSDLI